MIDAYVEGFLQGRVPSELNTPKAVAVAFLLGDHGRMEGSILDINDPEQGSLHGPLVSGFQHPA